MFANKTFLVVSTKEATTAKSTQAAVGVGTSVSAGASLLSMSSPIGIFSMINQYQLLLLLLVWGVYISDGVNNLITGMKIALANFDFINIENFFIFKDIYKYLSFEQTNESLNKIGISSGSTLINMIKLFFIFLMIILMNLAFFIMLYCWRKLKFTQAFLNLFFLILMITNCENFI